MGVQKKKEVGVAGLPVLFLWWVVLGFLLVQCESYGGWEVRFAALRAVLVEGGCSCTHNTQQDTTDTPPSDSRTPHTAPNAQQQNPSVQPKTFRFPVFFFFCVETFKKKKYKKKLKGIRLPCKPVNFVPYIDEHLKYWFKKDSLWFCEDLSTVPDHDADRICILQGPVAAAYSTKVDEPVASILGTMARGIHSSIASSTNGDYVLVDDDDATTSLDKLMARFGGVVDGAQV